MATSRRTTFSVEIGRAVGDFPALPSALPDSCVGGYDHSLAPVRRDEASEVPFLQGRSGLHRKEGFGI
jgi:hypothetical protein